MPKTVSGIEILEFLSKKGFEVYSRKSSHVKLISRERNTKTIIPMHKRNSKRNIKCNYSASKINGK